MIQRYGEGEGFVGDNTNKGRKAGTNKGRNHFHIRYYASYLSGNTLYGEGEGFVGDNTNKGRIKKKTY